MWTAILLLEALSIFVNGTSLPLHNGSYALQRGPVTITSNGLEVAEFNSTAGVWRFNVTRQGTVIAVVGAAGVNSSLEGAWYSKFSGGLVAYVRVCIGKASPPQSIDVWQGTTPVEVPGVGSLLEYSPSGCGWLISIEGNSTELAYLTYFNQYSWTAFELEGRNWSVVVVLGEAQGPTGASATPLISANGSITALRASHGASYIPLIVSTAALALALVVEIDGRRGAGGAEVRQARVYL